ncbi:MAG: peptidylprolyl isomerase, partial [Acetatifactor sp.]|nr:peptidylprolyl isomerase [Acetatifactor sp.]
VVELEGGYHLIHCVRNFDREVTDANKQMIVEERRGEVFGREYDAFVETLVRSMNEELWQEITLVHDEEVSTGDFFEVYERTGQSS